MSDEEIEKYNDSFMMIERLPKSVGIERALQPNVYEKEIWNAAIEAAAKIIDDCNREGPYNAIGGARRIRELKNEGTDQTWEAIAIATLEEQLCYHKDEVVKAWFVGHGIKF